MWLCVGLSAKATLNPGGPTPDFPLWEIWNWERGQPSAGNCYFRNKAPTPHQIQPQGKASQSELAGHVRAREDALPTFLGCAPDYRKASEHLFGEGLPQVVPEGISASMNRSLILITKDVAPRDAKGHPTKSVAEDRRDRSDKCYHGKLS